MIFLIVILIVFAIFIGIGKSVAKEEEKKKNEIRVSGAPIKRPYATEKDNHTQKKERIKAENELGPIIEEYERKSWKCLELGMYYEVYSVMKGDRIYAPDYVKKFSEAIDSGEADTMSFWVNYKRKSYWWVRKAESGAIVAAGGVSQYGKPFRFWNQDKINSFYEERKRDTFKEENPYIYTNQKDSGVQKQNKSGGETVITQREIKAEGYSSIIEFSIGDEIDRTNEEVKNALRNSFENPDFAIEVLKKYAENEIGNAYKHEICKILRSHKRYEEELPVINQILEKIRSIKSDGYVPAIIKEYAMGQENMFERRLSYVERVIFNKNKRRERK